MFSQALDLGSPRGIDADAVPPTRIARGRRTLEAAKRRAFDRPCDDVGHDAGELSASRTTSVSRQLDVGLGGLERCRFPREAGAPRTPSPAQRRLGCRRSANGRRSGQARHDESLSSVAGRWQVHRVALCRSTATIANQSSWWLLVTSIMGHTLDRFAGGASAASCLRSSRRVLRILALERRLLDVKTRDLAL